MDVGVGLLAAYLATLIAGLIYVWIVNPSHRERLTRLDTHARGITERAFYDIIDAINRGNSELVMAQQAHLERMTTPVQVEGPGQPTQQPSSEYIFGEAAEELQQFHDTISAPPVEDTPDWTDMLLPNERGEEPRVATVRPGDSIVPGQGNWDEMVGEGRAVANGGVVSGEDQWNRGGADQWNV